MQDRYLKVVLTVIALELAWIGVKDSAPVSAQQAQATRVIITGVDIAPDASPRGSLPVTMRTGEVALRIQADQPLRVESERALPVFVDRPVKVEADQPLKVEQVPYTPGRIPGE